MRMDHKNWHTVPSPPPPILRPEYNVLGDELPANHHHTLFWHGQQKVSHENPGAFDNLLKDSKELSTMILMEQQILRKRLSTTKTDTVRFLNVYNSYSSI